MDNVNTMTKSIRSILYITFGAVLLSASTGHCDEFDLRLSDDAVHTNIAFENEESQIKYGGGYFYKDADNSINILNFDLHSNGQTAIGNLPTTVGLGIQGNAFKESSVKGSAIGLGGSVRVNLPDAPGLSLETSLHFAPDVLAFSQAKRFTRARIQANYRVIRTVDISGGYRYVNTKLKSGEKHTFESGLFLGLKLVF